MYAHRARRSATAAGCVHTAAGSSSGPPFAELYVLWFQKHHVPGVHTHCCASNTIVMRTPSARAVSTTWSIRHALARLYSPNAAAPASLDPIRDIPRNDPVSPSYVGSATSDGPSHSRIQFPPAAARRPRYRSYMYVPPVPLDHALDPLKYGHTPAHPMFSPTRNNAVAPPSTVKYCPCRGSTAAYPSPVRAGSAAAVTLPASGAGTGATPGANSWIHVHRPGAVGANRTA
jgi:hypothetical protein